MGDNNGIEQKTSPQKYSKNLERQARILQKAQEKVNFSIAKNLENLKTLPQDTDERLSDIHERGFEESKKKQVSKDWKKVLKSSNTTTFKAKSISPNDRIQRKLTSNLFI